MRERQDARRAEVTIAARYPEHKPAPVSGIQTQELYTLFGTAVATASGTRRLIGVAAQGMTACPCAQQLVEEPHASVCSEDGFDDDQIERDLRPRPGRDPQPARPRNAAHRLPDGADDIDAAQLLAIVEESMSSEIYEMMKRSDEGAVVEKAHRRPRFVEDCVREMIAASSSGCRPQRRARSSQARQENLETIHQHNVVAERFGLLGELTHELGAGEHASATRRCASGSTELAGE